MNRILVLYDSASGNSAKMAALIADGAREVPEIEVRLRHLDEAVSVALKLGVEWRAGHVHAAFAA